MTTITIDPLKQEAFAGALMQITSHAFLGLAVSVGHRTGLFDTMSRLDWATSPVIADAAGLQERYVREWLAAMVVGGIVEYHPAAATYALPPEHAAFTTTAAGPNNLASFSQFLSLLGSVESELVDCFRNGGGVPYSRFGRFQELMRAESTALYDAALVDGILPLIAGMPAQLEAGIDVADIGCGSGHAINVMARAYPNSRFTGYDFSEEGVATGRREAAEWGLANARFEALDAAQLDAAGSFDLITAFDAIHDQAQPRAVLANIARALRPGGTFLMVDIAGSSNLEDNVDNPIAPLFYCASLFHCMTVSLALDGEGLGAMWGEEKARELLAEAGFTGIDVRRVEEDIQNLYYIATTQG